MRRRASWWLLLLLAGILGGLVALSLDRGLAILSPTPTPPTSPLAALPTPEPLPVVVLPTTVSSTPVPAPASGDTAAEVAVLRSALAQQGGLLLVARAERHTALAAEALAMNNFAVADRELVAARVALDSAFGLVPEDLKQVINGQRREVGRMRSELQLNPEGMDERLRATQDLLLGLLVPPTP